MKIIQYIPDKDTLISLGFTHIKGSMYSFGDCLELMRDIPDGSIDAIITE